MKNIKVSVGDKIYKIPSEFVDASILLSDITDCVGTDKIIPLSNFNLDTRTLFPSYRNLTKTEDMDYKLFTDACCGRKCEMCDPLDELVDTNYKYIQLPIDVYEFIEKNNLYPKRDNYFGEMLDITMQFLKAPKEERLFYGSRSSYTFEFSTCKGFIADNNLIHWDKECGWVDGPSETNLIPFVDFTRFMWMWDYLNMPALYNYGNELINNIVPMGRTIVQLNEAWSLPSDALPIPQIEKRWIKSGGDIFDIDINTLAKYDYDYNFKHINDFLSCDFK